MQGGKAGIARCPALHRADRCAQRCHAGEGDPAVAARQCGGLPALSSRRCGAATAFFAGARDGGGARAGGDLRASARPLACKRRLWFGPRSGRRARVEAGDGPLPARNRRGGAGRGRCHPAFAGVPHAIAPWRCGPGIGAVSAAGAIVAASGGCVGRDDMRAGAPVAGSRMGRNRRDRLIPSH